jgi:hypothetical protein
MITKLIYGFIYTRKFVYVALVGSLLTLGYFFSLSLLGDPRTIDNGLTFKEAHWWELIILLQGLVLIFGLLFFSEYHAYTIVRKRIWAVLIMLFWPLSFIYSWLYFPSE